MRQQHGDPPAFPGKPVWKVCPRLNGRGARPLVSVYVTACWRTSLLDAISRSTRSRPDSDGPVGTFRAQPRHATSPARARVPAGSHGAGLRASVAAPVAYPERRRDWHPSPPQARSARSIRRLSLPPRLQFRVPSPQSASHPQFVTNPSEHSADRRIARRAAALALSPEPVRSGGKTADRRAARARRSTGSLIAPSGPVKSPPGGESTPGARSIPEWAPCDGGRRHPVDAVFPVVAADFRPCDFADRLHPGLARRQSPRDTL